MAIRSGWLFGVGLGLSWLMASEGCGWQAPLAREESEAPVRQVRPPSTSNPTELGDRLDINSAGRRELESLPGIGPVLAGRIVEFRTKNPPFRRVEEILIIRGIGRRKFEALRDLIRVGASTGPPGAVLLATNDNDKKSNHEDTRRKTKGHQGAETNRDGIAR